MDEMKLLQLLYLQEQKHASSAGSITNETLNLTSEQFESARSNLLEHHYITEDSLGQMHITKKGCLLAKEL